MSDLPSDLHSRAEELGATEKGFRAWLKLEGHFVTDENYPELEGTYWDEYLDRLEYGGKVMRCDFMTAVYQ